MPYHNLESKSKFPLESIFTLVLSSTKWKKSLLLTLLIQQIKTCFMPYHNVESNGEFPLEGIFTLVLSSTKWKKPLLSTLLILVDKLRIVISHSCLEDGTKVKISTDIKPPLMPFPSVSLTRVEFFKQGTNWYIRFLKNEQII